MNVELKTGKVLFEVRDQAAYITLNDPEDLNPVTVEVIADLMQCIRYCETASEVRAVVLRGAGGNFSAGGNVKAMKDRLDQGVNVTRSNIRTGGEFIMRLKTLAKPTIAWVEGAAAGFGMSIIMACDFAIADEASKMVFAFVNIGFVPDGGAAYMLCQLAGPRKATELLMSGRRCTGAEAAQWGIINEAVPAAELEETVGKYIRKYANGPGVAYGELKKLINSAAYRELNACMQMEVSAQDICSRSEDHYNALAAFVDKKKPAYKGR